MSSGSSASVSDPASAGKAGKARMSSGVRRIIAIALASIAMKAAGGLASARVRNRFGDSSRKHSVEGAIRVVDSTTPAARAFVRFGGPQAHGLSLTVVARQRPR